MQPSCTPAVSHAIEIARLYARGADSAELAPTHVLHALLEEEEGRAATLAVSVGLDLAAHYRSRGERPREGSVSLPFSPGLNEVLSRARNLSLELTGDSTLSSESLLLALLRADVGLASAMEAVGLRLSALEAVLQQQKPPALKPEEPLELADVTESHGRRPHPRRGCQSRSRGPAHRRGLLPIRPGGSLSLG